MRYAILGDVHSNLPALEAVLADIDKQGAETILCVGDVVGYAADPKECLQIVRERAAAAVAGNHDCGTVDSVDMTYFNEDARDAIEWTKGRLSEEELSYLADLPLVAEFDELLLVHSTPYYPGDFAYIQTLYDAALAFSKMQQGICFVGHSHVPVIFAASNPIDFFLVQEFDIPKEEKVIVNVGSVGQPRDMDPRASYALLDTDKRTLYMRRLDYDINDAEQRIQTAGLPDTNGQRLHWGR